MDFGLMLIGLWLFIQLNPATLLFGAGDLRDLLAPLEGRERRPEFFVSIEAFTTAANLVAVALLLAALASPGRPVRGVPAQTGRARGEDRWGGEPDARRERFHLAHARGAARLSSGRIASPRWRCRAPYSWSSRSLMVTPYW
jgi:hypothetical protein